MGLHTSVSRLQAERDFSEHEFNSYLDTQLKIRIDAMNAGKAMLQEAMRYQQMPSDNTERPLNADFP